MARGNFHEDYRRGEEVKGSSERAFGLVFTVVFTVVGLWPLIDGAPPRLWALAASAGVLALALLRPRMLAPFNRLWLRFGLLLHRVVSPILMGLIFFTTVTPIGLALRLLGKNPLGLHPDRAAKSYWIPREPPGPAPETMRNQF